ncbi:MAG TPA: ankyrin repeat domain-containing protein [Pseudomonadales bacterium]|nr:ankyrin repeat domain-containing protein [Pseudomonadales bacterium]
MRLLPPRLICAASLLLFIDCHAQAITTTPPAAPAAVTATPAPPATAAPVIAKPKPRLSRQEIDRLISDAHTLYAQGHFPEALAKMQDATTTLQETGYDEDQAAILRDMTLDPNPDYARTGKRGLAEHFYRKYLNSSPRDAKWLLEALGWAHYAGADDLLKNRFTSRLPDKSHENIDARGEQRGKELQADDQLFLVFEDIRQGNHDSLQARLKNWPYPIDLLHSAQGTSLLHMAVWYQKIDVVKQLVEQYKANINTTDKENDTPLDYAYHQKNTDIIKYLTARKAKANKNYQQQMFSAPAPAQKPVAPATTGKPATP